LSQQIQELERELGFALFTALAARGGADIGGRGFLSSMPAPCSTRSIKAWSMRDGWRTANSAPCGSR